MLKLALPYGSTLRSVSETMTEEYVRRVLVNVAACDREMGDAVVALSLTGDEYSPNYSVSAIMDTETGQTSPWQSFSGQTHKPLRSSEEMRSVWSNERMTLREVSALIGEIRGFKAGRRNAQGA